MGGLITIFCFFASETDASSSLRFLELASSSSSSSSSTLYYASSCLIPTTWTPCKLLKITPYNHDTSIFEFAVPDGHPPDIPLQLPTCACVLLKAPGCEHAFKGGGDAVRPYTPISPEGLRGKFQLLIKRYQEWGDPPVEGFSGRALYESYRPAGAVSNYLHTLKPGEDSALFAHRDKNVKIQYPFRGVNKITMVAVGVGIAPMIQALEKILETPGDNTQVTLLYGNRSVRDILLKEKLDAWSKEHGHRLKVVYAVGSRWANVHYGMKRAAKKDGFATTLDALAAPPTAHGFEDLAVDKACNQAKELGWVDERVLKLHAHPPARDTKVFVCGLPGVYDKLCGPRNDAGVAPGSALANLGYEATHVVKF